MFAVDFTNNRFHFRDDDFVVVAAPPEMDDKSSDDKRVEERGPIFDKFSIEIIIEVLKPRYQK